MKDFNRGWMIGLLTAIGLACIAAMAADYPPDLVGTADNSAGGVMFFSTYQKTLDGKLNCTGNWHAVVSTRPSMGPAGSLFGCWSFIAPTTIGVIWMDGDKTTYSTSDVTIADWFTAKYPGHGGKPPALPSTPDGKMQPKLNDTQL